MMQSLVFKRSEYFICMAMINSISTYNRNCAEPGRRGGGGAWEGLSKEIKMASKVFIEETDKNFDFSKALLFISWIWRF